VNIELAALEELDRLADKFRREVRETAEAVAQDVVTASDIQAAAREVACRWFHGRVRRDERA
jgi:hypothetical protein